jgi:hypothetical protein
MAVYKDIYLSQGADYIDELLMVATDGSVVDVEGYIFTSQLRTSYVTANAIDSFNVTVTDVANGIVSIILPAANTSNIPAGKYVYDIKMYDTANVTTRIVEGLVIMTPQATWANGAIPPLPYEYN